MPCYSLSHLADSTLDRDLVTGFQREDDSLALQLARIAEFDSRRRYAHYGYSSMHVYCVEHLHRSDGAAYRRITAARKAREFPALFDSVAEGRLHLTAILLLAPHLTLANAAELIALATHKGKREIERLLVLRFPDVAPQPRPDSIRPLGPARVAPSEAASLELVPEQIETSASSGLTGDALRAVGANDKPLSKTLAPARVDAPRAPEHYELRCTIRKSTHGKLERLRALLGTSVRSGDLDAILERAFDAGIARAEKQKYAATDKPPAKTRTRANSRHIPAEVKRAVWKRDGGRCTFVSDTGHRCESRSGLEFDHIIPFARGGQATVGNLRLRCRAHNQYEAERAFGAEFMSRKCRQAQYAKAPSAETRALPSAGSSESSPRASVPG